MTENDSDGRLLVVSLGQLQLFTTEKIRVALGDQLYDDLLATRLAEGTEIERIFLGDPFTERDWTEDYRVALSLFERIDIRILNELNLFASLGAPESNLDFWTDGSFRVGGAAPGWEAAILFPWSGGSIGIGPVGSRLLTPGYGASLMVETSFGRGRVRFTDAASARTEATRSLDRQFIHTLSGELTGRYRVQSGSFDLTITGGFDVEQFDELVRPGDTLRLDGYIRRLSPVADIAIVLADNNIRATLGYYDLAFRASLTARLSRDLWLESRLVAPGMTRELAPFEHPATFFITPRIRF